MFRLGPAAARRRFGLQAVLGARPLGVRWNSTSASSKATVPPKRQSRKKTTTIDFDDLPAFKADAEGKSVGPLEDLLELGRGYKEGRLDMVVSDDSHAPLTLQEGTQP